jgi:hypothetical protein
MGWLTRLRAKKLGTQLASDDGIVFIPALRKAVTYAPKGSEVGLQAMEIAMQIRSGRTDLEFFCPSLGGLIMRDGEQVESAPEQIVELASKSSLLTDPSLTQNLISACMTYHGHDKVFALAHECEHAGGVAQLFAYQLLYNHMRCTAVLAKTRGAKSFTDELLRTDDNYIVL